MHMSSLSLSVEEMSWGDFLSRCCSFPPRGVFYLSLLAALTLIQNYSLPNSVALLETSRPMMRPNSPRTELKISITKILTNLQLMLASFVRTQIVNI